MLAVVEVFAAGQTNAEMIQLLIDNVPVETWSNIGGNASNSQFVRFAHNTSGSLSADRVRVAFTNDLYDPANGIDRNVRIDAIQIDGVLFETESPSVYSTGTWLPADGTVPGYRQSEFLHSNGYFQYANQGAGTGSLIEVRARGDEGGERGELRIDGAVALTFVATTAFETYTFRAEGNVTADQVQIFFTNDLYDGTNGIDRNLVIDYINIDGTRFETEAPSVFSTGTWRPEDGVTPGYRLSQELHSNGYFAYGQTSGVLSLTLDTLSINENQGQLNFVVFRTGGSSGSVQVDYTTTAGTASVADFSPVAGTLTFGDGITSLAITVNIVDDSLIESPEQFSLSISNPRGGATLGATSTQVVTIEDNDEVFQGIIYSEGFEGAVTWTRNPNSNDRATSGLWETGAPQQTNLSGGILQFGSGYNSPRALVTGLAAGASSSSFDVDGGVTSAISPQISLPANSNIELRFFYNFSHSSTSSDYFRMSVVSGSNTQLVFSQTGSGAIRQASWREVSVNLSSYAGQSIRLLVQAADAGGSSTIEAALDDVVVEALANLPGTLSVASTTLNVDESAGSAVVTVSRSQGRSGTVTVGYRTVPGTASESDFQATQGTLTFANGELSKTISIPIVNDTLQEQLESFQLEILNPGGGAILGTNRTATITIVDNDNSVQDYLPDLVAVADTMRERLSIDTREIPGRKLMRFSTESANIGRGPIEIWGGSVSGNSQQVFQRIYQAGNTSRDRLAGNFVYHANHGHVHFEGFATYHLRTTTPQETIVASGGKTSFCLINIRQPFPNATANAGRVHGRGGSNCGQTQGISVGYSDVYEADLDGQWIDITGIANGNYWLEMVVNPSGNILESDTSNNVTRIQVNIQNSTVSAGVEDVGAPATAVRQTYTTTGQGTVVALIDSGVDLNNAAIVGQLWQNLGEVPGDGIDNDGNGFVDDVNGFDFVDNDAVAMDSFGHGTFTAGLLVGNNGIADDAKLMVVRAINDQGQGTDEAIAASIRYAVANGAQIVGLPVQSGGSEAIREAVEFAQSRNVLLVAAAGNGSAKTPSFIAALSSLYSHVISVGGLTSDGSRLPESNGVGKSGAVQIDAPGVAMSNVLAGDFATFRGTSVATGFVTGAAALALAANPGLTAAQLRDVLVTSASLVGPLSDSQGTLDIQRAINTAASAAEVTLVQIGTQITIKSGATDDDVRITSSGIKINGIGFTVPDDAQIVIIRDQGGNDRIQLMGTSDRDTATIRSGAATFSNALRSWNATGFEFVNFDGAAGTDTLLLYDTPANDFFRFQDGRATLTNPNLFHSGTAFEDLRVFGSMGFDSASITGTNADDSVEGSSSLVKLISSAATVRVNRFENVIVDLLAGLDRLSFVGGAINDTVSIEPSVTRFRNKLVAIDVHGSERIKASGGNGTDTLSILGGTGNEIGVIRPNSVLLTDGVYRYEATGFETTRVNSGGGNDHLTMYGSTGTDVLTSTPTSTTLLSNLSTLIADNFARITVYGGGGVDRVTVTGTSGNDTFSYSPTKMLLRSSQHQLELRDIAISQIFGGGGSDTASVTDDISDDVVSLSRSRVTLKTSRHEVSLDEFRQVNARSVLDSGLDTIRRLQATLSYVFRKLGDWREI